MVRYFRKNPALRIPRANDNRYPYEILRSVIVIFPSLKITPLLVVDTKGHYFSYCAKYAAINTYRINGFFKMTAAFSFKEGLKMTHFFNAP